MTQSQKIKYYEQLMGLTLHCLVYRRDFVTELSINEEALLDQLKRIKLPEIDCFNEVKK